MKQRQHFIAGFQGKVWIYAQNMDSGKEFSLRGDEQTRTASTIKLAIMAEAFHQVAQGKLKWDEPIELTKEKKQELIGSFRRDDPRAAGSPSDRMARPARHPRARRALG